MTGMRGALLLASVALAASGAAWAAPASDFPADPGLREKVGVVLEPGPRGSWDAEMVESPSVARDGDRWVMAYTGYSGDPLRAGVGLAYSDDGRAWSKAGQILSGVTGPVLYRDGDRWVLYYVSLSDDGYEGGEKSIGYATAPTLDGPWVRHDGVIEPDGSGWDAEAVWHVSAVQRGAEWFLFFNGTGEDGRERIGYATGPSLVGPWVVAPEPVLSPRAGEWDSRFVGDPSVRREGDRWVMTYYGFDGERAADAEAVTTDADFPHGWQRTGVVLAPSEDYDAAYAHKPFVTRDGGDLLHFYTAVSDAGLRQIALAVQ